MEQQTQILYYLGMLASMYIVGKQVGPVLRSNHRGDDILSDIAQFVCKKYTWHISITAKSFQGPKKTYQVNHVVVALGRQPTIPRICSSIHVATSSCEFTTSIAQLEESPTSTSDRLTGTQTPMPTKVFMHSCYLQFFLLLTLQIITVACPIKISRVSLLPPVIIIPMLTPMNNYPSDLSSVLYYCRD